MENMKQLIDLPSYRSSSKRWKQPYMDSFIFFFFYDNIQKTKPPHYLLWHRRAQPGGRSCRLKLVEWFSIDLIEEMHKWVPTHIFSNQQNGTSQGNYKAKRVKLLKKHEELPKQRRRRKRLSALKRLTLRLWSFRTAKRTKWSIRKKTKTWNDKIRL